MDPDLLAIAGPLEGGVFPLTSDLSVGREKSNGIAIDDRMLSRLHCSIHNEQGEFFIRDLGSSNGTYVNGIPISIHALKEGDQIRAGQSVFVFTRTGRTAPLHAPIEMSGTSIDSASTLLLKLSDALYLQPQKLPKTDETVRSLETLLNIGLTISSTRGLEALQRKLLQLILEAIPAQRGAILLAGKNPGEFASVLHWNPEAPDRPMQVSRMVVDRILKSGVALLSNDVLQDPALLSETVLAAQVRALLAVPLIAFERTTGIIYLDSQSAAPALEEHHLQLLTAIAGIAAAALDNALHLETLQHENSRLKAQINIEHDMVGNSSRMREVFEFISKAAPSAATILIRGESGTGKELVARAIHRNSARNAGPFVAINCAALTESLLESELFGHEKGAFTGAVLQKKGKLEAASGGTVFLDELGELAPGLQAKLLRVLQERQFERVGGTRSIKADIRLIAATNRDLEEAVRTGLFRRDLYYRLNVVSVVLPPLRERREDILPLSDHILCKHARNAARHVAGISEEAQMYLVNYEWPGNVRELENAIERAIVLGSTELILPDDLPESVVETAAAGAPPATGFHALVRDAKRQIVLQALEQTGGNYAQAAKRLNMHPSNLHRLIRVLNLKAALD
jgi:transcriptional regulator with GAF, ATPase, and Fis domain